MKKGNLLTKIILRGVLISSVFFITNSTFAGGAGPDAGYKIGGSIKDLEVFKKQKRELIPDVTKLPGYSIVMEQLSQLYSYAPSVAVLLTNSLTSKNWYFAEFPKNDTSIEAERIGRQDENNIYLSYDYKAKPCSSSCSHADENKIRLQGQLIYHEMWVKIARQQWNWNSNNPGHPNQNDVENVVGTLLSQGESYQKSISPQNSLEILLTEFNFRTERTYYGSGRYHAMVGETWPSQFSKIMNFLNSRGIVAKVVYNPRGYIQISFTSDERFKTSTTSTDYTKIVFNWYDKVHFGFGPYNTHLGGGWSMCGNIITIATSKPYTNLENKNIKLIDTEITCSIDGNYTFDMDTSGNLIVP